ncbi:MAG: Uma2 family endonuclease [Hydrococcus sp. CRU_1_1]|nr:Uma2 family endonuclease [Hydrococcus sp. CRU_1_1]
MTTTIARWTIADYHAMIETGLLVNRHVELLNGLIVEMPPEGPDHADTSTDALERLISVANGRYRVRPSKPITIPSSDSEPEPDIALVKPKAYRQSHPLPEDVYLVIEFSNSSLAKDTSEKRRTYATALIQEYWVVNLPKRELIIYRQPANGDYQSQQRLTTGSLSPLAFPDVVVDIGTLLA